ncbi:growth-regulating factor 4-like, partial [Trifolium medium]|nr:growth-regulating factor 4-like [Trifolium medium]
SQWQELEHQALIFKYMVAGLPVPPDLVLPIQTTTFHSNNFFHHPIPTYEMVFYLNQGLEFDS